MTRLASMRALSSSATRTLRAGAAMAVAAGAALFLAGATPAEAASGTVQIPGPSFVRQCPCDLGTGQASAENGVLSPNGRSTYYAPIPYTGIKKVCGFSAFYRDVNANERMRVRLFSRSTGVGGSVEDAATLMGQVESASGVPESIRKVSTTDITGGTLKPKERFYYVQVDFDNINMNLVGVQLDMRDSCN